MRGLTAADTVRYTLGTWIDYIIEYNNMKHEAANEQNRPKRATQAEIDMLAEL